MAGLLLIEFAVTESFHRAVEFPFLHGLAKARGVPARWVRFGVSAAAEFHGEGSGVPLSAEDAAAAARHMDETGADRVVFSHKPAASVVAALNRGRTDVRYRYAEFASKGEEGAERMDGVPVERLRGDLGALGIDGVQVGASLLEAGTPDFGFFPGNAAAAEMEVLPFLIIGEECTWNRSFLGNPFYDGLDLSACFRGGGCAFCARPDNRRHWSKAPMDLLDDQLRAVAATCPTFDRRLRLRLVGEPVIRHIREVASRVIASGLPPADLLLDSRADTLVQVADDLRRALVDLEGTGHCLHLCLIGIESFSSRELARMNKGLRGEDNIDAVRTLFTLEAEHPGRFAFRQYGGLSLITYTPWTAPGELDLNLAVLELLNLAPYAGKHLTGRLRLYPGLPLELRTRADGLLRDRYDDPLLDTARLTFYENEIPWGFRDPVMEPINRLLVRLEHDGDGADPLTAAVRSLDREARGAGLPRTTLAHVLIREALRLAWPDGEVTPEALLGATGAAVRRAAAEAAPSLEQWTTHGPPDVADMGGEALPFERVLDVKPVSKIEPLRREDVDLWLVAPAIPNTTARRRGGESSGGGDVWEVFFGRDPADVARAIHLTDVMDAQPTEDEERDAIAAVGVLLGYAPCCAKAYARETADVRTSYFWLHVDRRLAAPGQVPWEHNPIPGKIIEYVPCALDCAPSLARARANLDSMPWTGGRTRDAFEAVCRNPHLLLWDVQSSAVELIPESAPGERFRYRAGRTWGAGPDIDALAEGDEVILEEETVRILRKGRPWLSLSGRAFLWWHEQVLQREFWRAMLNFRRAVPRHVGGPAAGQPALRAPANPTMAVLDRLLDLFRDNDVDFGGLKLAAWSHRKNGRALVRLEGPGDRVDLMVEARSEGTPALWEAGPYALSYPSESPLRTDGQWAAAKAFKGTLSAAVRRLVRQSRER
ncbi:MAG: hypothetical protein ABIK09_01840 [Pseudomonadota bacterium]